MLVVLVQPVHDSQPNHTDISPFAIYHHQYHTLVLPYHTFLLPYHTFFLVYHRKIALNSREKTIQHDPIKGQTALQHSGWNIAPKKLYSVIYSDKTVICHAIQHDPRTGRKSIQHWYVECYIAGCWLYTMLYSRLYDGPSS